MWNVKEQGNNSLTCKLMAKDYKIQKFVLTIHVAEFLQVGW